MLNISGAGQTLPTPMSLYPSELLNAPIDTPSNYLTLAPGDALTIPAQSNQYLIDLVQICTLEGLDPVTGAWRAMPDCASRPSMIHMQSNGVDKRIANRTGCPIAAIVQNGGSGFTQATATLTANVGGSTWVPVIGGSLTVTSVTNVGANYLVPPLVLIPCPTPAGTNGSVGGIPATAYATVANGTVSAVSMDNFGAGYFFAPTAVLVPSPFDPNFGTISNATVTLGINAATTGAVTGAICTNFGAPLATISALTLTAAGGLGTGATVTPQVLQTIVSASVVAGGAGFGTATASAGVFAVGGGATGVAAAGLSNPAIDFSGFKPSTVTATGVTNAGGTVTSVTFQGGGGLFLSSPGAAVISGGTIPTALTSITFTMGSSRGTVMLQNL
jgi:hypothetical protein